MHSNPYRPTGSWILGRWRKQAGSLPSGDGWPRWPPSSAALPISRPGCRLTLPSGSPGRLSGWPRCCNCRSLIYTGPAGGPYAVRVENGKGRLVPRPADDASLTFRLDPVVFNTVMIRRMQNPMLAMLTGKIHVKGFLQDAAHAEGVLAPIARQAANRIAVRRLRCGTRPRSTPLPCPSPWGGNLL